MGWSLDHWWQNSTTFWMAQIVPACLRQAFDGDSMDPTTPLPYLALVWWFAGKHCFLFWESLENWWSYSEFSHSKYARVCVEIDLELPLGLSTVTTLFLLLRFMKSFMFFVTAVVVLGTGNPSVPSFAAEDRCSLISHLLSLRSGKWRSMSFTSLLAWLMNGPWIPPWSTSLI